MHFVLSFPIFSNVPLLGKKNVKYQKPYLSIIWVSREIYAFSLCLAIESMKLQLLSFLSSILLAQLFDVSKQASRH